MEKRPIMRGSVAAVVLAVVLWVGTAKAETLAQVIEGAKKEGDLTLTMRSGITPKSIERLEKEIAKKFAVSLKMKFVPSSDMRTDMAKAIMETKAGTTPSYDLLNLMESQVTQAMKADALERVDWKPIITKDTNPNVVIDHPALRGALAYYTGHVGLMYNPEKVSEVPKSLKDLADPKWKGKVGIFTYEESWARYAFVLGKEKLLSDLRGILKNGAIRGRYVDLQNRYYLGEIPLCFTASVYLKDAQDKGMPAAWKSLDLAEIQTFTLSLQKGAQHPNAAKLVAIYLASQEGSKFMLEESGAGNLYYPGNLEYDISLQSKKDGVPEYSLYSYPGMIDFLLCDKYGQSSKEIKLFFDTVQ